MSKRKSLCLKNRFEWIKRNATCKQLRSLSGVKDRKVKRCALILLLDANPPNTKQIQLVYKKCMEAQRTQIRKKSDVSRTIIKSRKAWKYLSQFIQFDKQIMAKIKPCVFYNWKYALSRWSASCSPLW